MGGGGGGGITLEGTVEGEGAVNEDAESVVGFPSEPIWSLDSESETVVVEEERLGLEEDEGVGGVRPRRRETASRIPEVSLLRSAEYSGDLPSVL